MLQHHVSMCHVVSGEPTDYLCMPPCGPSQNIVTHERQQCKRSLLCTTRSHFWTPGFGRGQGELVPEAFFEPYIRSRAVSEARTAEPVCGGPAEVKVLHCMRHFHKLSAFHRAVFTVCVCVCVCVCINCI